MTINLLKIVYNNCLETYVFGNRTRPDILLLVAYFATDDRDKLLRVLK